MIDQSELEGPGLDGTGGGVVVGLQPTHPFLEFEEVAKRHPPDVAQPDGRGRRLIRDLLIDRLGLVGPPESLIAAGDLGLHVRGLGRKPRQGAFVLFAVVVLLENLLKGPDFKELFEGL